MIELGQEDAAALHDVHERALKVLAEAEPVIWRLPKAPERDQYLCAHAGVNLDYMRFSEVRLPL